MSGRELLRELTPRHVILRDTALGLRDREYPSVFEDKDFIRYAKGLEIRATLPQLRLTELGQSDPAGRYRRTVTGDVLTEERAASANWATSNPWLQVATNAINLRGDIFAANTASFGLGVYYGTAAARYGGHIVLYGHGHATEPGGIVFHTSVAAGTSEQVALRLSGATGTPQVRVPQGSATGVAPSLTFVGNTNTGFSNDGANTLFCTAGGINDMEFIAGRIEGRVAQNIFTTTTVPLASTLAASQLRFVYNTGGGTLVAYVNDGGTIKSVSLGTPV